MTPPIKLCASSSCSNQVSGRKSTCSNKCRTALSRSKSEALSSKLCPTCKKPFNVSKSSQIFCSSACKSQHHNIGKSSAPSTVSDSKLAFDTAFRLAEIYYSLPYSERQNFIVNILKSAKSGNTRVVRALTTPCLVAPNLRDSAKHSVKKSLFPRKAPQTYLTIAEICNNYCKYIYGVNVLNFLKANHKPKRPLEIELRKIDSRFGFGSEKAAVPSESEIDAAISQHPNRANWVLSYYKQVMLSGATE